MDHLKHADYTPRRIGDLAHDLGIPHEDLEAFSLAVRELADDGLVEIAQAGHVALPSLGGANGEIIGVFRKNPRGFGFVQPQKAVREGAIYIHADDTLDALSGDVVRVQVARDRRPGPGSGFVGIIREVVKRKRTSFTGELVQRGGQWLVFPDGRELTEPIIVRDAESKNARAGDKVVVELTAYPESHEGGSQTLAEGVITRVLGDAGRPDVETQAVIAAYNLPGEFPEACIEQARDAAAEFDRQIAEWQQKGSAALGDRLDLTGDFILTIDPPDAKDYDDAISIRRSETVDGGWELGIHIADVSHFIPPGSPLDDEARDRANSCYLPRLVIPMLPEILSNGIHSLQEGVPRFCKSAFVTYDRQGNVKAEGVANTLIKSAKRLTYLEAQALINGDMNEARKHAQTPPKYTDELLEALAEMNTLSRAIHARRKRQGMIELELPECVLIFDEHGHVVDAEREDDAYTHKLIEMFMVEANEVLARLFEGLQVPLLRPTPPRPRPRRRGDMRKAAMVAGFRVPKNPTRDELQGLLDATRGTPAHALCTWPCSAPSARPSTRPRSSATSPSPARPTRTSPAPSGGTRPDGAPGPRRVPARHRQRPQAPQERQGEARNGHGPAADQHVPARGGTGRDRPARHPARGERRERRARAAELPRAPTAGEAHRRDLPRRGDGYLAARPVHPARQVHGRRLPQGRGPARRRDSREPDAAVARGPEVGRAGRSAQRAQLQLRRQREGEGGPGRPGQARMELVLDDAASRAAGKAKKIATGLQTGLGGGFSSGKGAGFGKIDSRTGSQKRDQRSKARDRGKKNWRRDK